MRTTLLTLVSTLLASIILAGCATDDPPMPTSRPPAVTGSPSAAPPSPSSPTSSASIFAAPTSSAPTSEMAGPVLDVSVDGDDVGPNAERIEVQTGQEVTINVTSDRAGQLHVHSKPDQYVDFAAGTSTFQVAIETPGVVDVEEHDTSAVVAQLEVR